MQLVILEIINDYSVLLRDLSQQVLDRLTFLILYDSCYYIYLLDPLLQPEQVVGPLLQDRVEVVHHVLAGFVWLLPDDFLLFVGLD